MNKQIKCIGTKECPHVNYVKSLIRDNRIKGRSSIERARDIVNAVKVATCCKYMSSSKSFMKSVKATCIEQRDDVLKICGIDILEMYEGRKESEHLDEIECVHSKDYEIELKSSVKNWHHLTGKEQFDCTRRLCKIMSKCTYLESNRKNVCKD